MEQQNVIEIYSELEKEIGKVGKKSLSVLQKLAANLKLVRIKILKLEEYLTDAPLKGPAQEIAYFKSLYPLFYGQLIYYAESFNIERNKPVTSSEDNLGYLADELKIIDRFFQKNAFLYNYYLMGLTELDQIYFTRHPEAPSLLLPEISLVRTDQYTQAAVIFSKMEAYQRIKRDLLMQQISFSESKTKKDNIELKWTGDSINLAELAYGLWLTGQINHGEASVSQIVKWLEIQFMVKIGVPFRRWTEISQRKTISPAKFSEELARSILERLQDENGL